jgi:hypothetical protein
MNGLRGNAEAAGRLDACSAIGEVDEAAATQKGGRAEGFGRGRRRGRASGRHDKCRKLNNFSVSASASASAAPRIPYFGGRLLACGGNRRISSRPDLAKPEVPSSKGPGFDPSRIQARLTLSSDSASLCLPLPRACTFRCACVRARGRRRAC